MIIPVRRERVQAGNKRDVDGEGRNFLSLIRYRKRWLGKVGVNAGVELTFMAVLKGLEVLHSLIVYSSYSRGHKVFPAIYFRIDELVMYRALPVLKRAKKLLEGATNIYFVSTVYWSSFIL